MSKGRIIISTTTDNVNKHEAVRSHHSLLTRQFSKFPDNKLRHAIGMFEGKEELSVIIDIPSVPFIVLAATAHDLAKKFNQKSVYFSHGGHAFLATAEGDMIRLGTEHEGTLDGKIDWAGNAHTRIIGGNYYIWTKK